ncbi:MAG: hypothetical protein WD098_04980 [Balneolales bacterium]
MKSNEADSGFRVSRSYSKGTTLCSAASLPKVPHPPSSKPAKLDEGKRSSLWCRVSNNKECMGGKLSAER